MLISAARVMAVMAVFQATAAAAEVAPLIHPKPITDLKPIATLRLGETADWVAITADAVWVGSTGPFAVHRIDPRTNRRVAVVELPGEPCAGLATGFGSLWVPLCTERRSLAKVDLSHSRLTAVFDIGPAREEGGVTTSRDSVWLVSDVNGSLARIDPKSGALRQTIQLPRGSYNPLYAMGRIWVTHAEGSELTSVDTVTGAVIATARTGPNPRFLTASPKAVWTLNQGDGSLTRVDSRTTLTVTTPLGIPGHGGDIKYGDGLIWTTVRKIPLSAVDSKTSKVLCQWVGEGGDSLGIGHGSIWLTDYHGGTVTRFDLKDAAARCRAKN